MSTNWQSDLAKGRNWLSNDLTSAESTVASRPGSDTRLPDRLPYDGSTAAMAAAQIHIAALFQNIRQVLDRSRLDIATQLRTTPRVIEYLETGRFQSLPPWNETSRIVSAYTYLVGIDPGPALHVLQSVVKARTQPATHPPISAPPQTTVLGATPTASRGAQQSPIKSPRPQGSNPAPAAPPVKWRRGRSGTPVPAGATDAGIISDGEPDRPILLSKAVGARFSQMAKALAGGIDQKRVNAVLARPRTGRSRAWVRASAGIIVCLIVAIVATSSPSVVRFAHAYLPGPIADAVLSVHNVLSPPRVYERDGKRWIEVADPRMRRTDKLPLREE